MSNDIIFKNLGYFYTEISNESDIVQYNNYNELSAFFKTKFKNIEENIPTINFHRYKIIHLNIKLEKEISDLYVLKIQLNNNVLCIEMVKKSFSYDYYNIELTSPINTSLKYSSMHFLLQIPTNANFHTFNLEYIDAIPIVLGKDLAKVRQATIDSLRKLYNESVEEKQACIHEMALLANNTEVQLNKHFKKLKGDHLVEIDRSFITEIFHFFTREAFLSIH